MIANNIIRSFYYNLSIYKSLLKIYFLRFIAILPVHQITFNNIFLEIINFLSKQKLSLL